MKEQREESVRTGNGQSPERLQRYMEAFYSEALLLYDINVTKDLLEEELCGWMDGREIHLLPLVGLKAPCSFSEYVSRWADTEVLPKDRESYRRVFSRDYLLDCAKRGDREFCIEYGSVAGRAEKAPGIVRQTLRLMENESGDTIARCVVKDVTAEREKEARLLEELQCVVEENRRLAYMDELTGCPNKKGFLEVVRKSLEQHPEYQYGMCYCDINNLSYVNSTYGYEVGNELLRYWIGCVKEFLSDDEVVGRISGDYFAIFLNMGGAGRRQELEDYCQMIQRKVNLFFKRIDRHFNVMIYSGIYMITSADIASMAFDQMLDRALIAQKSAKESGDNRIAYYNEEQWEKQRRSIEITQHLTESIKNGEIEAWIQPQYALSEEDVAADGTLVASGENQRRRLIGGEVLSRWDSSFLGRISPAEFISVLEARGQIYELDKFIWEQACRYLRRWLDLEGCEVVPLSVNISRRDVMEDDLCSVLYGLLDKYCLTPDLLHLEITESAYMNEPEKLIRIVQELQEYGFTIEMDDFGSGYSSLNMLKEVPVDTLKMDLRFLKETGSARKGGNIISSIIRMSQGLNISVIAEGVEKVEQSDALRNMGCLMMQGYYFAKPMPCDEFEKLLMTQQTGEKFSHMPDADLLYINDLLDPSSRSAYIFNHYSSGTAILESFGEHIEVMSINDEFLHAIGDRAELSRQYMKDGLALIREADHSKMIAAVHKAEDEGRAECEVYFPRLEQWARLTFRHVVRSRGVNYLFSEAINTTEEHRLQDEVNHLMGEMNTQMDLLPAGMFRYEADGRQEFDFISNGMLPLLNYNSMEELREQFHNCFPDMVYEEDRERVLREIDEQIARNGSMDYCEYRIRTGDGSLRWVYDHGRLVTDENGKKWFYVVIADLDQVKKERMERDLQAKRYQAFVRVPGINIFDYDLADDCLMISMTKRDGHTARYMLSPYLGELEEKWVTRETADAVRALVEQAGSGAVRGTMRYEGRLEKKEYSSYRCYYTSIADDAGRVRRITGIAADIANEVKEVSGWRERAQRDEMTKLLNHDATIEAVRSHLLTGNGGMLMMLDVDNFKWINDAHGHLFGDEVLKKIAGMLQDQFRRDDVLGRYGGDEFVVFLPGVYDRDFAQRKAEQMRQALGKIIVNEGRPVHCCLGIAIDQTGEKSAEELLFEADTLMYGAKADGKNRCRIG